MNSVSFNPSQKSPDGHKSLGRGGSFWLPPKMSTENFETNLKQFSKFSSSQKNLSSKSNLSGEGGQVKGESFKSLLPQSQSSAYNSADKSNPSSIPGVMTNGFGKSSSSNLKSSVNLVTTNSFLTTGKPLLSNDKNFADKSLTTNISTFAKKPSSFVSLSLPNSQGLKKRTFRDDGTKSAFDLLNDNLSRELPEKPTNETEQNQSGPFTFDQFSDKVSTLIFETPVLFSAHQDVVRFAVTLDNGSSVSVRIENMKDFTNVCFVSEDMRVLEDLSDKFSSKSLSSNKDEPSLNFYFFDSYSQMDRAFSKTNPQL